MILGPIHLPGGFLRIGADAVSLESELKRVTAEMNSALSQLGRVTRQRDDQAAANEQLRAELDTRARRCLEHHRPKES